MSALQEPTPPSPWSQKTRDAWFFGALALSTLGVAYVFSTFLYTLMFASVVVVVSWPLYERLVHFWDGRRALAAVTTAALLVVAVFGPLGFFGYLFVKQAVAVINALGAYLASGAVTAWVAQVTTELDWMPLWLQDWLPEDFSLQEFIAGPLQESAMAALNLAGNALPGLLGGTLGMGLDIIIFVFSVITLYMEGPRVLKVLQNLSPMDDRYEDRLFAVFGEFANNLVLGALATATIQGTVAGIGYAIAGVDRVVFFAMLTAVCALVPFVGTVLVWVPLSIVVGMEVSIGWGIFLFCWGVGVAQLDNIIRPLFMRGRTNIHPLLIFLAVFGGIASFGLPGALIGPVMVAGFLALYTIYAQDYLGQPAVELVSEEQSRLPDWAWRLVGMGRKKLEKIGVRKAGAVEPTEHQQPTPHSGRSGPPVPQSSGASEGHKTLS